MSEGKKPKIKFVRASDGSLDIPRDMDDDVMTVWDKQSATLEFPAFHFKPPKAMAKPKKRVKNESFKEVSLEDSGQPVRFKIHEDETVKQSIAKKTIDNYGEEVKKNKTKESTSDSVEPIITNDTTDKSYSVSSGVHSVTIHIPALRIPRHIRWFTATGKRKALSLFAAVGLVAIGSVSIVLGGVKNNENVTVTNDTSVAGAIAIQTDPEFPVLSPDGGGVDRLGGFAQISPPGSPPVYAYKDTIEGIPIRVSQQKIPQQIGTDEQKFKDIAKQYNATQELAVGDFTAYIGTSINGPQSVLYTKGDILVLISSDNKISSKAWVTYIGSLRY